MPYEVERSLEEARLYSALWVFPYQRKLDLVLLVRIVMAVRSVFLLQKRKHNKARTIGTSGAVLVANAFAATFKLYHSPDSCNCCLGIVC